MDIFKGLNVLVADDSKLNNRALKQLLEVSGASVTTAENGLEAIECLRASLETFHLIIMDVNMPVLDGLEATRIIRQDKHFTNIPIIAATASQSPHDQLQCFQAGMDAHITKPLDYETLCTTIKNTLDRKYNQLNLIDDKLDDSSDESCEVESKQEILKRFADNTELVKQMLLLYQQEFQQLISQLNFEISQNVRIKTHDTLHALKGLASTVGAKEVVRKIEILGAIVKSNILNRAVFYKARQELKEAQQSCLEQLNNMFGVNEVSVATQKHQVDSCCLSTKQKQKLIKLLQSSDLSVISQIEKIKNEYPENSFVLKLSEFVNQLKFDQAIALLLTNDISDN